MPHCPTLSRPRDGRPAAKAARRLFPPLARFFSFRLTSSSPQTQAVLSRSATSSHGAPLACERFSPAGLQLRLPVGVLCRRSESVVPFSVYLCCYDSHMYSQWLRGRRFQAPGEFRRSRCPCVADLTPSQVAFFGPDAQSSSNSYGYSPHSISVYLDWLRPLLLSKAPKKQVIVSCTGTLEETKEMLQILQVSCLPSEVFPVVNPRAPVLRRRSRSAHRRRVQRQLPKLPRCAFRT